jgi:hypothetical protein
METLLQSFTLLLTSSFLYPARMLCAYYMCNNFFFAKLQLNLAILAMVTDIYNQ